MAATTNLNILARRLTWMDQWRAIAGFAKIEAIDDNVDVTKYITKYAVKGGNIELSENLKRYYHQGQLELQRAR